MERSLRAVAAVAATELRRTLRDPHVVAYLMAPIVLYPMILWGALQLSLYEEGRKEREPIRVEVTGPAPIVDALSEAPFVAGSGGLAALDADTLDVIVEVEADGEAWTATVHHASTRPRSRRGLDEVRAALGRVRKRRLQALAEAAGVAPEVLDPPDVVEEPLNGVESFVAGVAALIVGYIGAFAMLLSAIYPAIDVVVAEREKGTLETMLLVPTPRFAILVGKAVGCATLVGLAALGNMGSLWLTLGHMASLMPGDVEIEVQLGSEPLSMLLALPALAATALLVSSIAILAVLPARTFKEGEVIVTTAVMSGLLPIIVLLVAVLAGESEWLWWLPVANLMLVLQRALMGELSVLLAVGVTLEGLVLAGLALAAAAALAGREDFLVGGRLPRWLAWMHRSEAA